MENNTCYSIMNTTRTVAQIAGIPAPEKSICANTAVTKRAAIEFSNKTADRVFLYNPDAIANWLFRKYTQLFEPAMNCTSLQIPIRTVLPSVTPVCFASMYTGALPEVHGIMEYSKPVVKTDTLFDAYIRENKKPVIISTKGNSMSEIFLERDMDYYIYNTPEDCNDKAEELIRRDEYDMIVLYNGDYDASMHRSGPEAQVSLDILSKNIEVFARISNTIKAYWQKHRTLLAFLPDHGCHEIEGNLGSHGLDMPEDMEIVHMYSFIV